MIGMATVGSRLRKRIGDGIDRWHGVGLFTDARDLASRIPFGRAKRLLRGKVQENPLPQEPSSLRQPGQYLPLKISAAGKHRGPIVHNDPTRSQDEIRTTISRPGLAIGFSMCQKRSR